MGTRGDLGRLERWNCVKLMEFNKAKRMVLRIGQGNPNHRHRPGETELGSPEEKDPRKPSPGVHHQQHGQQVGGGMPLGASWNR